MDSSRKILVVDDERGIRDLLTQALASRGYACSTAEDGLRALARLEKEEYAVVLVDIRMPELGGLGLLKRIKDRWAHTEVIIITGVFDVRSAIESMRRGAYDYVTKPFAIEDVLFAVERALYKRDLELQSQRYQQNLETEVELRTLELLESNRELQQLFISMLRTLANTLEAKDPYTHGHSERVAAHAVGVGKRLELPDSTLSQIELAGLLHDIGKIGVREEVLHKPGKLTDEEYEHIKRHPEIGESILRPVEEFDRILDYVRHHHERVDGKGYPDGLPGEKLSLGAKILGVCDAYDAMTSQRPYRPALSHENACEEIRRGRDTHFDHAVGDAFLAVVSSLSTVSSPTA